MRGLGLRHSATIMASLMMSGLMPIASASPEPEPEPRRIPPPAPPLTPEQIKAAEKRARKAKRLAKESTARALMTAKDGRFLVRTTACSGDGWMVVTLTKQKEATPLNPAGTEMSPEVWLATEVPPPDWNK